MSTLSIASRLRQKVLGYPIDIIDDQLAQQIIDEAWRMEKGLHVVTLNAEMVIAAQQDQTLDRIIRHAHLIIPDGSGVVWALKLGGQPAIKRLPGIELACETLARAAASGRRVALIGGKPEVLEKLLTVLPQTYPGLNIVASHHGYFTQDDEEAIVEAVAEKAPELVLVALGVPKQEYCIDRWQAALGKAVLIGVGGSFDVWVGDVKRAPLAFRKIGCEWLYRLIAEPWRFKRMSAALPAFALQVMRDVAQNKLRTNGPHAEKRAQSRQLKKHDKKKERSKDK